MFLVLVAVLALTLIYLKIIKPYNYWTDRGVKQRKQTYLLGDNARMIFRTESFWDMTLAVYNAFPEERYIGIYQLTQPILLLRDPDLIKQICIKDFDHFVDHIPFLPESTDNFFARNLFSLNGNNWRDMRSTLSPSFTSSKMKFIFGLISECAEDFTKYFLETANGKIATVELKDTFTRYTNDVIATTSFGIKCDSLRKPDNEFYLMGKDTTTFAGLWKTLKILALSSIPRLAKVLGLSVFSKKQRDFFERIIKEAIRSRENNGIVRPDMLQLLVEAKNGRLREENKNSLVDAGFATVQEAQTISPAKVIKQQITDLDIAAQAVIFFFGGFESVSTALCFLGHELVENPEIQGKLQKEIDGTLEECDGTLTYEIISKMKYLDMVVSEILRKWPATGATDRICTKPYTIQPTKPTEKPIQLKEGDMIWIPISGMHRDPQYFPDPDRFDPERFNDVNKVNINPFTYHPFGVGPRSCVGSRFALLEIKALFFHLLSKFDFVRVEKTQIPLKLTRKSFNLVPDNGFWVGLKPRNTIN